MVAVVSFFFCASACFFEKLAEQTQKPTAKKLFSDTANCLVIDLEK
jgi:hypothetical protein